MRIRVLIADDHAVLRSGLRMLINTQPDLEVVGEAGDGSAALRLVLECKPDVVTVDLTMPGGEGIPLIERLRQQSPATRVLVLTMHDDPAYLRAALAAGAMGYVVKTAADTELLSAIRAVHSGRTFVDLKLAPGTQALLGPEERSGPPTDRLSRREREILQQLAEGHTNQQIADQLFLSVKTVETYRSRITQKTGLRSRSDIIRYALDTGLIGPRRPADPTLSPN